MQEKDVATGERQKGTAKKHAGFAKREEHKEENKRKIGTIPEGDICRSKTFKELLPLVKSC
jgi:hypothetical protein